MIPAGYCQCNCGQRTKIATKTDQRSRTVKGQPLRFIHGHNAQGQPRRACPISPPNPEGICWCGCGKTTPIATASQPGRLKGHHTRYIRGHAAGEMTRERWSMQRDERESNPLKPMIKAYLRVFDEWLFARAGTLQEDEARMRMTERLASFWPIVGTCEIETTKIID